MKYQTGALVTIRPDLEAGRDYGNVHVFDDMSEFFGCSGVVRDVIPDENAVKVCGRWWSEEAVRPIRLQGLVKFLLNI